jgi:hypothetical protein
MSGRMTFAAGAALALVVGLGGCSAGASLDAATPLPASTTPTSHTSSTRGGGDPAHGGSASVRDAGGGGEVQLQLPLN